MGLFIITVGLMAIVVFVLMAFQTFDTMMEELREGEWTEVLISVMLLGMYLTIGYFIQNGVRSAWVLAGF